MQSRGGNLKPHAESRKPKAESREPTAVIWDVLANRHVRCARCLEPVQVTKERGRVILDEMDGSAPHECGREPDARLAQARDAARAAVEATLKRLAERQEHSARESGEAVTVDAAIATAPKPRRPRRAPTSGTGDTEDAAIARTSRDCPSCGRLMAGTGDTLVCLYCGS